jgi:hypothetical protein
MADFLARINFHAQDVPGRILRGWHWDVSAKAKGADGLAVPTMSIRGLADLPGLRIYLPDLSETFRPARHTDGTIKINILVATKRTNGVVTFIDGIQKVVDALQNSATDPWSAQAIDGTVKHFDWEAKDNFILENSLNSHLSISLHPRVGDVGNHRNTA